MTLLQAKSEEKQTWAFSCFARLPSMASATLVLLIFAFVLFFVAALNVPARFNLVAAGLACWVLSTFIGALH